ncbi:hypothetical protein B0J11DRAFT_513236 [Dendryphion nanum]|uniref:Uncharacterized protein n=1 Tax=Dendryphion nanum TaxID=256645 RepID=A0A9P9EGR3_9PLEO|nr:hypothetical protein B0J11DRAFT_513236 [Dendryphion nanum]
MHGKQHSLPPGPGPLLPGRERPPPPPNHGRPPLSDHKRPPPPHHSPPQNPFQNPMHTLTPSPIPHGYLHTYTPAHPLHLLYIDGLSAGKTSNGTLDTQDLLLLSSLLPNSSHTPGASPGTGMSNEYLRASHLCNLTHSLWANKISGFLRMEGGFEIILCDFSAHVNVSSIIGVSPPSSSRPGSPGVMGGWPYIQALTSRYDGIGGDRIMLDYENFVSVFAEQGEGGRGLALWDNDVQSDVLMPRLTGLTKEELVRVRDKVTEMVLQPRQREGRDWQGVVDLVVRRYSGKLHFLITDERVRSTKERFLESLEGLLRPFVDFGSRDTGEEIRRCVAQFVPEVEPGNGEDAYPLAYRAVHAVTTHICSTLISTHDITAATMSRSLAAPPPARALEIVDELVAYLQWTTWKECGTCGDDEVCWIPIWPMGELEDHKKPVCRNESAARGRTGYWGGRFFGPRPPPGKGEDRRKKVNGKGKAGSSWIARVAELLENLTLGWWS